MDQFWGWRATALPPTVLLFPGVIVPSSHALEMKGCDLEATRAEATKAEDNMVEATLVLIIAKLLLQQFLPLIQLKPQLLSLDRYFKVSEARLRDAMSVAVHWTLN